MATAGRAPDLHERAAACGVRITPLSVSIGGGPAGFDLDGPLPAADDAADSVELLRPQFDRIGMPEYPVRFRSTPNAVAIRDHRAMWHDAVGDDGPAPRSTERGRTIAGDVVAR